MHIIHIIASYKPAYIYGGPIMSVAKLCEGLSEAKVEIEVLTTTANGKIELDVKRNKAINVDQVKVTYFKRWTKDHTHFSPALLWHLNKLLRQAQHDKSGKTKNDFIIHIHAWWNLVSVLSCLIAKWHDVPVILSPRGMLTTYTFGNRNSISKRLVHQFVGKRLLKYCHIHATSLKEKEDILQITKPKSITVIPNLVNLGVKNKEQGTTIKEQEARSQTPLTTEIFKIIFLSRIEEKKGLELLLDALAELEINWELTIAGSGEEKYINNLKERSVKDKNRIHWIGQVTDEAKFNVLAEHDLMALTSYNENFANVVIESLSMGTPVLISKEVGLADYVAEKNLGWITDLNLNDIKQNIVSAFEQLDKRKMINKHANKIINLDFNAKTLVKKYISLYNNILSL